MYMYTYIDIPKKVGPTKKIWSLEITDIFIIMMTEAYFVS